VSFWPGLIIGVVIGTLWGAELFATVSDHIATLIGAQ
jgi:hypothetical protein